MLSPLAQRLLRHLRETSLIPAGSSCLIALSGGGDSVALSLLLLELKGDLNLTLSAAHLNHNLRPEAEDDARFVQELCQRLGLPLLAESADVRGYAQAHGLSLEAAGRRLRYALFIRASQRFGTAFVATAHTASDQAETVLMRLIAGTGLTGLCGIRPHRRLHAGALVRPLLIFRGDELRDYLRERQQPWREDITNHEPTAPRTQVRLQLIPLLKQWNPHIVENLTGFSARVRQDERFLQHLARSLVQSAQHSGSQIAIDLQVLNAAPPSLRQRAYRRWLPHCQLESSHIQALDRLVAQGIGFSHLDLPRGYQADIVRGQLLLSEPDRSATRLSPSATRLSPSATRLNLADESQDISPVAPNRPTTAIELLPGCQELPAWGIDLIVEHAPMSQRPSPQRIYLNPEAIKQPLLLRSRRPGDVLYPAGGLGKTKLKKYLNSLKLSAAQRDALPLLCCGDDLVWVLGYRADQRFLARPLQENVWSVTWRPRNR